MFDWLVNLSAIFVFNILGFEKGTHLGDALEFFIFDTIKIFILLITIIYLVTVLRSYFPIEKARDYISGKNKIVGHFLAAIFGVLTPFCSCSAIPLFLGFSITDKLFSRHKSSLIFLNFSQTLPPRFF